MATNPDVMGPGEGDVVPSTGAVVALISVATGIKSYFVGKPNQLLMRMVLRTLHAHTGDSAIPNDRRVSGMVAGIESGQRTILVLIGVTSREQVEHFPIVPPGFGRWRCNWTHMTPVLWL